jgi:hypothetical protein
MDAYDGLGDRLRSREGRRAAIDTARTLTAVKLIDFIIDHVLPLVLFMGLIVLAWLVFFSAAGHFLLCDTPGSKVCP